jgi:hypothetical protein
LRECGKRVPEIENPSLRELSCGKLERSSFIGYLKGYVKEAHLGHLNLAHLPGTLRDG